tara:strand:- start:109 stop:342 length:234 start_codon:yes stop_codon:yes gene_type:complete
MADLSERYQDNVNGRYFVDEQCIDCNLCREEAPKNFTRQEELGYSYVYKQPEGEDEEEMCKNAMKFCPVEAIGDFGE